MTRLAARLCNLASVRALLGLVLVLGTLGMQAGGGTLAFFTSSATSTSNAFSTGSLVLQLHDTDDAFATGSGAVTQTITFTNMAIGDKVTAWIQVRNNGNIPARYAMDTSLTGDSASLGAALKVTAKRKASDTTPPADASNCTNANFGSFTATDTPISNESLNAAAFGTHSAHPYTGDFLTIAGTTTDTFCIQVTLPAQASENDDNALQGKSTTATLNFFAEQSQSNT